ncbi:hypothetical protein HHX48_07405 [Salinimonas sp. HHU 13199]|uniref:Uncharacterized protein n=1 Tax=Salinimonas profundi TaxID=2729140 RepID=A0ABR8LJQ4_9ALTE|nr:hypothetical protein [Salinimonas profundi]MBD3585555.1 hypothetical protein [Salinimonas profundi]
MTLNQLPTYATSLIQAQRDTYFSTNSIPRPQRCDTSTAFGSDAESQREHSHQNARAYHDALLSSRRRRKYDSPQVLHTSEACTIPQKQYRQAATEAKRSPAKGLYAGASTGHQVHGVIDQLRQKALLLQLLIMNNPDGFVSATSRVLFERLTYVQKVLQNEVEHEAERLRHFQPETERCGNLIDEIS